METIAEKVVGLDYTLKGSGRWKHTIEHSSLVIDVQNQKIFWNSKGLGYLSPIDYLLLVKKLSRKQAEDLISDLSGISSATKIPKTTTSIPDEKLVDIFWKSGMTDRDYWYKRTLTDTTIDLFRLGKYDGFSMVPIYYKDEFINFQCRKDDPKKVIIPWYKGIGPVLFNSSILPLLTTVFITEGLVDSILLNQLGYPCISHTGGAYGFPTKSFSDFSRINKIFYICDNDQAGLFAARKVSNCLGTQKVKIVLFNTDIEKYDAVDFFREGHTTQEFEGLLDTSKYIFEIRKDWFKNESRLYL